MVCGELDSIFKCDGHIVWGQVGVVIDSENGARGINPNGNTTIIGFAGDKTKVALCKST